MTFGEMLKLEGEEVARKTAVKTKRKTKEDMILRMQQMKYPIDDMVTISGWNKKRMEAVLSKHAAD